MPHLGDYPTPVLRLERTARAASIPEGVSLWCKRDDLTSPLYGGNKVRKLERLLDEAAARGAKRIVTVGAVGSHHVLATAIFARRAGFDVDAVLGPQPWTPHVEEVARVGATLGFKPYPVKSFAAIPLAVARRLSARGTAYFISPGGSSVTGSLGYVDAASELAGQISRGELPRPTSIVVALGSGGTVAGLLVGLARAGLLQPPGIEVVAAQVVDPPLASAAATLALSLAIMRRLGEKIGRQSIATISRSLRVVSAFLGKGYGHATDDGARATAIAESDGLSLDATYTAKAFAAAIAEARRKAPGSSVLYWHTLAAPGPFQRLLATAPPASALDPRLRALMTAS